MQTGNGNDQVSTSNATRRQGRPIAAAPATTPSTFGSVGTVLRSSATGDGFDSFSGNTAGDGVVHRLVTETNGTLVGISGNYGGTTASTSSTRNGKTNVSVVGSPRPAQRLGFSRARS